VAARGGFLGIGRTFDAVGSPQLEEGLDREKARLHQTVVHPEAERHRFGAGRSRPRHKQRSSVEFSNQSGQLNVRIENTGFNDGLARNASGGRSASLEESSSGLPGPNAAFPAYSRNTCPN
jgi:hypothetical protein